MAHGFLCTVCGQQETSHTFDPNADTCGAYQSPNIDVEAALWHDNMNPYNAAANWRRAPAARTSDELAKDAT